MSTKQLAPLLLALFLTAGCVSTRSVAPPIELVALQDFTLPTRPDYAPAYRHQAENALAINAAKYKDRFAIAETVFAGPAGTYRVELIALGETDGESSYELFVDGKLKGRATNQPTTTDYVPQVHDLGEIRLRMGQTVAVAFNSASNGKIPEGEGFAFSRGRWTGLRLTGK